MRARTFQIVVGLLVLLPVGGCVTAVDPVTGEQTRSLDPNSPLVTGGEIAVQGVAAVGPFLGPVGILLGGIATGAYAAWKRVKPTLVTARAEAEHYHAAAAATVTALEQFKTAAPQAWDQLGVLLAGQLAKQGVDPKIVENVIRGLRGLPAKS